MERKALSPAVRISVIYVIVAAVWIIGSDSILGLIAPEAVWLQSSKGLLFVIATGTLLYGMLRTEMKTREQADAQIRYQARLLEHTSDAIVSTDVNFNVQSFNAAAERLYGWKAGEAIGKSFNNLVQSQYEGITREEVLKQFAEMGEWNGEVSQKRKDGSRAYCQAAVSYVTNSAGERVGVVAVYRDITEDKQAEQRLRDSEFFLRKSQTIGRIGSYYLDMGMGKWISSPMLDELFGIDDSFSRDVEGWISLVHPDHKKEMAEYFGHYVLEEHNRFEKEYRIIRQSDQQERWVYGNGELEFDDQGNVVKMIGTIQDVTERKRLEQDLLLTQFSVDHASMGIMRTGAKAEILSVNEHYCRLLGYTAEELRGMHVYDIDPKFPLARWKKHRVQLRKSGSDTFETVHRRKDGSLFPVEVTGAYVPFQGQEFAISFIQDITERKRAEEEIQDLARFPSENPDPIVRAAADGTLLYANNASLSMLPEWHFELGHAIPTVLKGAVSLGLDTGETRELEVAYGDRIYSFHIAPILEEGYANLYGRDITRRKQIEQRLRESQEKFATAFRSSAVAMAIATLDGTYVEVNQAFCDLIGFSYEDILGKSAPEIDLADPSERQRYMTALRENQGTLRNFELKGRTKNGQPLIVLMSVDTIILDDVPHRLSTMLDITESKRAETQLRESEAKFMATFQSSSNCIAITNPARKFIEINPAYLNLLGYSREEVIGKDTLELHIMDEATLSIFRVMLEKEGHAHHVETRLRTKDGAFRDIMASLDPITINGERHWLTNLTDIAERKLAEEQIKQQAAELVNALQQKEEAYTLLDGLMSTAPIGMAFLDRDLRYQRINTTLAGVNGIPAADHLGHTVKDLLPDIARVVEPIFRRVIETRQPVINLEVSGETPRSPGEQRHWLASYYPVIAQDGAVLGVGMNVLEITERKRAEEALRESEERFRALFENMAEGVALHELIYDGSGEAADYRIVDANPAYQTHTGISREDAIGKLASELYGTDRPPYFDIYGSVAQTGQPVSLETFFEPMGKNFRISVCATGEGRFATLFEDITERKRAEEALRDSEERFRTLVDISPIAIFINRKGRIDFANPAFMRLVGALTPEQVTGKTPFEFFLAEHHDAIRERIRTVLERHTIYSQIEESVVRCDGGIRDVEVTASAFMDHEGEAVQVMLHDITERKRAEASLKKESDILDMAHVLIRDLDSRIVFWNSGAERLYGWTREEALGQVSHALQKTVFPMPVDEIMEQLRRDGEWQGELTHTCRDGSTVTVASHWVLYRNEKGEPEGVLETNNDITALKAAENRVKKTNRIYAVLSSINEVIVRVREPQDLLERACEIAVEKGGFKMAWVGVRDPESDDLLAAAHSRGSGDAVERMVAFFNTEVGKKLPLMDTLRTGKLDIVNDVQHDPRVEAVRARAVEAGYRSLAAFPIRMANTVRGVLALYSEELGFFDEEEVGLLTELVQDISFALDIAELETQRREAERKVQESQARLQGTLDRMMEGCQIIDFEWRYYYLNDTAAEHGRVEKQKLLGRTMMEVYPGIEHTAMFRVVEKCMADRRPERLVNEFIYPDGTSQWFELSIQPVPEGVFILSSNITARKQAEDELRRLNVELEQRVADRTAELEARTKELESFSYSVSHDLKAPLRGIDGYSRLLVTDHAQQLDEEGREFVTNIRSGAQQMSQLIDDLLAYSRLERRTLEVEHVNPQSLAEALVAEHHDDLKRYAVSVNIPCNDVTADPDGLAMVLRNLIGNAIKFTREAPEPSIEIGGREDDHLCVIWVRDNGVGFDMKFHDRIFEIFQRLHRVEDYPGTGIGLAIARKAMERMDGRVWAESQPGHGATFYLELPRK